MLAVTILGNNSALPAYDRHPTAQIITMDEHLFLVDCGEGTQMQLSRYKIRRSRINHIFISHLHGDHYFGLIGLITSMGLMHREHELHLYAPAPLKDLIQWQLDVASTTLPFNIDFHPLVDDGIIASSPKFVVEAFKVFHRIDCWGFKFRQVKAPRKVNPLKARENKIPEYFFDKLKKGEDFVRPDGSILKNEVVTDAAPPARTYAFAADTAFNEIVAEKVQEVDLLYHEATYLKDLEDRATARFHCTTTQAATIAKKARVKKLLLGHFSSKYEKLDQFIEEAKEIFPDTELALEGVTYRIA
ncbi:MAG TPA: ribonuclease Z [Chitinophagaceae bacterium]|nr:ribonuclease Z [Chitinophagaceae bacterium]